MINANQYLKRRCGRDRSGERFYCRVPIPADLRGRFGGLACIERALNTSDPRVARIRRDAILPDIRAMFDRALAEPALADVIAAARREELARAGAIWAEAVANRGPAAARTGLAVLIEDEFLQDEHEHTPAPTEVWQRRARRTLLHHGLAATEDHIRTVAEAMLEAHVEAAELRERQRDAWMGQTEAQCRQTFKAFGEHIKDKPLAAITRADVAGFLSAIATRFSPKSEWPLGAHPEPPCRRARRAVQMGGALRPDRWRQPRDRTPAARACGSAWNVDPLMEWAPRGGRLG